MGNDGWTGEIVNIDFSSVVIDQMRKKYESKYGQEGKQFVAPKMKFVCADVTHGLPFKDKSFDLIICKGTFDSILCNSGSMSCSKDLITECERVLATGHGCLFLVTYGSPDNRVVFLEHENDISYYWQGINIHKVQRQNQVGSKYVQYNILSYPLNDLKFGKGSMKSVVNYFVAIPIINLNSFSVHLFSFY